MPGLRPEVSVRAKRPASHVIGAVVVTIIGFWAGLSISEAWSADEPTPVAVEVEGTQLLAAAPTSTTTPAPPTTTTTLPPLRSATLRFTGDTLAHRGVVAQAARYASDSDAEYNFAPMFDLVRPYLSSADVAICHLETPLSIDNRQLSGYPTFNVPRELADGLAAAGYDGCSTASNHSLDRRAGGVDATLDVLDSAGLQHAGMARSAEERASATLYDAAGITVANLSYSYGFNGFSVPPDEPWRANIIDPAVVVADAAAAREAGAEYVVVSLHWGTEYRHDPNDEQLAVADALTGRPEVDLIIGHHAHVVQPIEKLDGTWVAFGLGNFLSNQSANCCAVGAQDGVIVGIEISELRVDGTSSPSFSTTVDYIPTWVDRSDFTIVPIGDVIDDPDTEAGLAQVLAASQERTDSVIGLR